MPVDTTKTERKLWKLAKRLHQGWAEKYAVKDKDLQRVRQVVKEQWDAEQKVVKNVEEAREAQKRREAAWEKERARQQKKRASSQQQTRKRSHGHSH